MSTAELTKIFDYIFLNISISIDNNDVFPRKSLIQLRSIINGLRPNDFTLTSEQKSFLIETFKKSNSSFNEFTPAVILEDHLCKVIAIKRDINSIDYISEFSAVLKYYVSKLLEKRDYIIKKESPSFVKKNYESVLKSIRLDASSADYISWTNFDEAETAQIITTMIENHYVLSSECPTFLIHHKDICLASIKNDLSSFKYIDRSLLRDKDIFKYLLLHGIDFSETFLQKLPLACLKDPEVFEFYCQKYNITDSKWSKEANVLLRKLNLDLLNSMPTIASLRPIINYVALELWKEYRQEHIQNLTNIHAKICGELKSTLSYEDALYNIAFLGDMEEELKGKYQRLLAAMSSYHQIYHSDNPNKLALLQEPRKIISDLSSLYIAMAKESFIRSTSEDISEFLNNYFDKLKESQPFIKKRIIESRQKEIFKDQYIENDPDTIAFLDSLVEKYREFFNAIDLQKLFRCFILGNDSSLSAVLFKSYHYNVFKKTEKVTKLITRLNLGNIKFNGPEVAPYQRYIAYDSLTKQYNITNLPLLSEEKLNECRRYEQQEEAYNKVKRELMAKIKSIPYDNFVSEDTLDKLSEEVPFTDEYFEINSKELDETARFEDLSYSVLLKAEDLDEKIFENEEAYKVLYHFFIELGVGWMLIFLYLSISSIKNKYENKNVDSYSMKTLMKNIIELITLSQETGIPLESFKDFMDLYFIHSKVNSQEVAVLGLDIVKKLIENTEYVYTSEEEVIDNATDLVCSMTQKHKSTVPYISGESEFYKYSMYDIDDTTALISGHYTDSCLRAEGNENDFLHYTLLDKNGILIKITDKEDNFIGRVAGFRQGNVLFLNQLRTIYDEGGNIYSGNSKSEAADIIKALETMCEQIVLTSQKNEAEHTKIDFVFITQSYALTDWPNTIPKEVEMSIPGWPIENSDDWKDFCDNTSYLMEAPSDGSFAIDIGDYSLICLASSKDINTVDSEQLVFGDIEALYERPRTKIFSGPSTNVALRQRVIQLNAINAYLEEIDYKTPSIPDNSTIFIGDNWYLIWYNGFIHEAISLRTDPHAKKELKATLETLKAGYQNMGITNTECSVQLTPNKLIKKIIVNNKEIIE